jgi:hypothetical protein
LRWKEADFFSLSKIAPSQPPSGPNSQHHVERYGNIHRTDGIFAQNVGNNKPSGRTIDPGGAAQIQLLITIQPTRAVAVRQPQEEKRRRNVNTVACTIGVRFSALEKYSGHGSGPRSLPAFYPICLRHSGPKMLWQDYCVSGTTCSLLANRSQLNPLTHPYLIFYTMRHECSKQIHRPVPVLDP